LLFDGAEGFEVLQEAFVEEAVRFGFLGGEKDDLAGETVTGGVESGALFTVFGARAGGFLRVLADWLAFAVGWTYVRAPLRFEGSRRGWRIAGAMGSDLGG